MHRGHGRTTRVGEGAPLQQVRQRAEVPSPLEAVQRAGERCHRDPAHGSVGARHPERDQRLGGHRHGEFRRLGSVVAVALAGRAWNTVLGRARRPQAWRELPARAGKGERVQQLQRAKGRHAAAGGKK